MSAPLHPAEQSAEKALSLRFIRAEPTPEPAMTVANVLVSFDIDGTLHDGDPPGPIGLNVLLAAERMGYVIGTASDRTLRDQARLWAARSVNGSFVSHKHHLQHVADAFPAVRMVHIGDTDVDELCARMAGFEFYPPDQLPQDLF